MFGSLLERDWDLWVLIGEGPGCVGPYWRATGMYWSLLERDTYVGFLTEKGPGSMVLERDQDVWVPTERDRDVWVLSGEQPRCMGPY